jgi:hypothetical protein
MPVASANPAVAVIHDTKVVTAVAINIDDGPSHTLVRSEITKPWNDADEYNSAAKSSQAAAAVIIGPDPGPVYINPELTSGGNAAKSSIYKPPKTQPAATALAASMTANDQALVPNMFIDTS